MSDATATAAAEKPVDTKDTTAAPALDVKASETAASTKEAAPTAESSKAAPASSDEPKLAASSDKPTKPTDVNMKDAKEPAKAETLDGTEVAVVPAVDGEAAANDSVLAPDATPVAGDKAKPLARRKSTGPAQNKKLNKKGSRPKLLHLDAQPGDLFLVKLKGFPEWPVIVADESMLPLQLLTHRPVTACRPDGTYRDDYADGGKRAMDRTFPVMYLFTNEFSWVPNGELKDLAPEDAEAHINAKMRKDLTEAFKLAGQNHPLSHYKGELQRFQEEQLRQQEEAAQTPVKKGKKGKTAPAADEADGEDVEMPDAAEEDGEAPAKEKKQKKRKADESAETPQRSDSVKKPKIKLTTSSTPKAANGVSTPKSAKEQPAAKASKPKAKKPAKDGEDKKAEKEATAPKEPELTTEEKHQRKEKEVLFLRHKLQKGLLTREQEPKEEEMKLMSDYITKLEGFPDLEVSIIRATKINKVLKAILKLDSIPKEQEFNFKNRSQTLLDKWNKLLATDAAPPPAGATANGVNGSAAVSKDEPATNGVKAAKEETKESKESAKSEKAEKAPEAADDKAPKPSIEEAPPASAPVETAA